MGWVEEVQDLAEHFKPTGSHVESLRNNRILNNAQIDYYQTNTSQKLNDLVDNGATKEKEEELLVGDDACNKAAADIKKLVLSKSLMKADFNSIKSYFTKMIEIRKGFYCIICDSETQEKLTKAWKMLFPYDNDSHIDKFILSESFCSKFSNIAIPYVFYIFDTLRVYLDAATTLLVCQKEKLISINAEKELTAQNKKIDFKTRPVYKIANKERSTFQKCYTLKGSKNVFACQQFCTWFDLTAANKVVDGDVLQIKAFISFIKHNKNLFKNPENNILIKDIQHLEATLSLNWNNVLSTNTFFSSNDKFGVMDLDNTLVIPGEAMDPFPPSVDNGYIINLEFVKIIKNAGLIILLCFSLFK